MLLNSMNPSSFIGEGSVPPAAKAFSIILFTVSRLSTGNVNVEAIWPVVFETGFFMYDVKNEFD